MKRPAAVAELPSWEVHREHWPDLPEAELRASAARLRVGNTDTFQFALARARRVNDAQASGKQPAPVREDCKGAFCLRHPRACKFSLASHSWLGRQDPLFRDAN